MLLLVDKNNVDGVDVGMHRHVVFGEIVFMNRPYR